MRLEIQRNDGQTEIFETYEREIIIGRGSDVSCRIKSDSISREHLKIRISQSKYFLTDLNSSNGTFVNNKKLEPMNEIEWQTFFPLLIGTGITISLLPEKELIAPIQDKTRIKSKVDDNTEDTQAQTKAILDSDTKEKRPSLIKTIIIFVVFIILVIIIFNKPDLILTFLQ